MHRVLIFLAVTFFAGIATHDSNAQQQISRTVQLNGGLIGHMIKIGRSKARNSVAVTISIENKGPATAYLLQAGYATISDNLGNSLTTPQVSGISHCDAGIGSEAMQCLGIGNSAFPGVPLQSFTVVEPGRTVTINVSFNGRSDGPTMALTMNVFARFVSDVNRDALVDEKSKYRQFSIMPVGFSSIPVQDE